MRYKYLSEEQKDILLEVAWGLIANANEGNWKTSNAKWVSCAERWRDVWLGKWVFDYPMGKIKNRKGRG